MESMNQKMSQEGMKRPKVTRERTPEAMKILLMFSKMGLPSWTRVMMVRTMAKQ